MKLVPRRAVLRGAGVAVGLPWLEAMQDRTGPARAAVTPTRFLAFFSPNGYIRKNWVPTGGETTFRLPRILAPLEPHRRDIVVLDGLDTTVAMSGPGDDHTRGMAAMLTGRRQNPGNYRGGGFASGISVDQEIVAKTKPPTRFGSLELGAGVRRVGNALEYTSYAGSDKPLPVESDPVAAFARVFAGADKASEDAFARKIAERRSILDAVGASYRRLHDRLGAADRAKLGAHLDGLRALEKRVAMTAVSAGAPVCKPVKPLAAPDMRTAVPLQMELMTMALACDLTRVGSFMWERSAGNVVFTWLGLDRGHHETSHDSDGNVASQEALTKINTWYAERFAELLTKLKGIREGDGTMLDNTLVLWCNELARGNAHSHRDMPFVLAGGASGRLRTGRFLRYPRGFQNDLLVSLLNLMNVPATTFGDPQHCRGPLAGL